MYDLWEWARKYPDKNTVNSIPAHYADTGDWFLTNLGLKIDLGTQKGVSIVLCQYLVHNLKPA